MLSRFSFCDPITLSVGKRWKKRVQVPINREPLGCFAAHASKAARAVRAEHGLAVPLTMPREAEGGPKILGHRTDMVVAGIGLKVPAGDRQRRHFCQHCLCIYGLEILFRVAIAGRIEG